MEIRTRLVVAITLAAFVAGARADEPATSNKPAPPSNAPSNPIEAIFNLFGEKKIDPASQAKPGADPNQPEASAPPPSILPPNAEQSNSANAKPREAKFKIFTDYAAAVRESQLSNRPLLVVLGAQWCTWCRKLDEELETPEAATALADWVVVKVDVDGEPEIAKKLEASALPGLRILGPWQTVVASDEGFKELPELQEWLAANRATADPAKFSVLYDTSAPDDAAVTKLVAMLAETSPMARNAAMERLAAHPRAAAPALVQALKTGRLVQQICACDVLRRWQAPLGSIDPWQPESLQTDQFNELVTWSRKLIESDGEIAKAGAAGPGPQANAQTINDLLLRLMQAEPSERSTVIAQLLSVGPALAAEVRSRLAHADAIDDAARESLRELLYNVLASRKLRLQQAGIVAAVARLDLDSHRQAAETLLQKSEVIDQPLVDELTRDSDPLVRELAIRALGRLGVLASGDRIGQLLGDSDPNVRAAVLRMLAEHPAEQSVESLCTYLAKETNEDLLVHGAKCLGQMPKQAQAMTTLGDLASNSSWRVRAAAIDAAVQAIGKATDSPEQGWSSYPPGSKKSRIPAALANAILAAAFEKDAFVAERAAKALPEIMKENVVDDATLQNIAQTLADHPDQMQRIINASQGNPRLTGGVDQSQKTFAPLVKPAKEWLNDKNPKQIERAAVILGRFAPTELNDRMGMLLASQDAAVRLTALRAAIHSLDDYREKEIKAAVLLWASRQEQRGQPGMITPWYDVPEAQREPAEKAADDAPAKNPESGPVETSAAPPAAEQKEPPSPPNAALELANGLFGTPPPKPAPAKPDEEADAETTAQNKPKDELAKALPSHWMRNWHDSHAGKKPKWISDCTQPTQKLLGSEDALERAWAHAVWLALGNIDHVDDLLAVLKDSPSPDDNEKNAAPSAPTLDDVLSWLPAEKRFEKSKELILAAGGNNEKRFAALRQCTLIDDENLANWILDYAEKSPLTDAKFQRSMAQNLLRARSGGFIEDRLTDVLSAESYTYGKTPPYRVLHSQDAAVIPGYLETCDWLRNRYQKSASRQQRALALLVLATIDHKAAVEAAIGALEEAKADNDMLPIALAIAFSDGSRVNAERAAMFLGHPAPAVRNAALNTLASAAVRPRGDDSLTRFVMDTSVLPGLWYTTEKLSAKELHALLDAGTPPEKAQTRMLLLATGEQVDLGELERDLQPLANVKLNIAAALAKAERTDEAAVAYYRATYADVSHEGGDARLPALYEVLRNLPGDEVAELRRKMRDEKGAKLFNQNGNDPFGI